MRPNVYGGGHDFEQSTRLKSETDIENSLTLTLFNPPVNMSC